MSLRDPGLSSPGPPPEGSGRNMLSLAPPGRGRGEGALRWRRVKVMVYRYAALHLRNPARMIELFFWPLMELLVWGFFSIFLRAQLPGGGGRILSALLGGLIFWDILFRSQQSVTLALMEELWTRNILNILISPLRTWEWVLATYIYGLLKTAIVSGFLIALAWWLYALDITVLGLYIAPFFINLLIMGWAMGLFTSGLLLRWGHSAEALVWGVPFLIQPFSAIFYPLSVYPWWLKPVCLILPSTYVMEGMRSVVFQGVFPIGYFFAALAINAVYLAGFSLFYGAMLDRGRQTGGLVRLAG